MKIITFVNYLESGKTKFQKISGLLANNEWVDIRRKKGCRDFPNLEKGYYILEINDGDASNVIEKEVDGYLNRRIYIEDYIEFERLDINKRAEQSDFMDLSIFLENYEKE